MDKTSILRKSLSDNQYYPIKDMFRIALIDNKVVIDYDYSLKGRGSYVLKNKEHILLIQKRNSLSRGLKCKVDNSIYETLISELERK